MKPPKCKQFIQASFQDTSRPGAANYGPQASLAHSPFLYSPWANNDSSYIFKWLWKKDKDRRKRERRRRKTGTDDRDRSVPQSLKLSGPLQGSLPPPGLDRLHAAGVSSTSSTFISCCPPATKFPREPGQPAVKDAGLVGSLEPDPTQPPGPHSLQCQPPSGQMGMNFSPLHHLHPKTWKPFWFTGHIL